MYRRELRPMEHNGKKVWVVLARSEDSASIPEKSGVVRVDSYIQSAALTTDGKCGTKCKYRWNGLLWLQQALRVPLSRYSSLIFRLANLKSSCPVKPLPTGYIYIWVLTAPPRPFPLLFFLFFFTS